VSESWKEKHAFSCTHGYWIGCWGGSMVDHRRLFKRPRASSS
jgi:hypothetical protein